MLTPPQCILFDLDGTLLDSIHSIIDCFNILLTRHHQPTIVAKDLRASISYGSAGMLKACFNIDETHPDYQALFEEILDIYKQHSKQPLTLFPGALEVLNHLTKNNIPWGIVTNKSSYMTQIFIEQFKLQDKVGAVVCGDTLTTKKPDPAPLWHACKELNCLPEHSWFVGDSIVDFQAGEAAGMTTIMVLHGYGSAVNKMLSWKADAYLNSLSDLMQKI